MEPNKYYYNQQAANIPAGFVGVPYQNGISASQPIPGTHPAYPNVYTQHVPNTVPYPAYYQSAPIQQHYGFSGPPGSVQYVHVPQHPQIGYGAPLAYQPTMQQYNYSVAAAAAAMPTAQFDEGARFKGKGGGSISIPPPAPGYAATPAQIAAMQGRQVMTEKKKNDFLVGSKGGFTFW